MTASGLDPDEARSVAQRFGVAIEQVRRDHLISHILAALSRYHRDDVVFFGGTALARTHLPMGRLSEDIDLIAVRPRSEVASALVRTLARALRRSHGAVSWAPALTAVRDIEPAVVAADSGRLTVRVQLLNEAGYEPWPTEQRALEPRYGDVPSATLRVPTVAAFAAWKTAAWLDRHAPRDLYDLWGLARQGDITPRAADVFVAHGPTGSPPRPWMFSESPSEAQWREQLSNQTRLTVTAGEALRVVANAWAETDRDGRSE